MAPTLFRRANSTPDENRNTEVFVVAAVFLIVAFTGLVARLSSKRIKRKSLQIDDILLIWAFVSTSMPYYSISFDKTIDSQRWGGLLIHLGYIRGYREAF